MCQIVKSKLFVAFVFLLNSNVFAQDISEIKEFLEELQKSQQEMRIEFQEMKSLLSRLPLLPNMPNNPSNAMQPNNIKDVEFEIGDNPVFGNTNAKLVIVEFTDYECPFCSRYVKETYSQIVQEYVDKGILLYTVIDQPLPIHPKAEKAAQAAHCAFDQGKYWEIHKMMMTQQDSLGDLSFYAKSLDMNIAEFEDCLKTDKYKETVNKNMALARKLGINGVPGFVIGVVDAQTPGSVKGISSVLGAQPFSSFQKEVETAISANK
jgi:protein-disulfide isomerase